MSTIIAKILNLFSFNSQSQDDFKSRVEQVIIKLELLMDRISELRFKFETRFQELWDKIIELMRKGEDGRARVYAGEAAQLRSMIGVVKAVENMVVSTIERLKTVKDVRQLAEVLMAFGAAVEEVREQARNLYPGLALALEEISKNVKSLIVQTSFDGITHIDPIVVSNKALEILNEAMKQARGEVEKKFPHPPVEPIVRVEEEALKTSSPKRIKPIEELLLNYIREHGGFLDIKDFMEKYGYSRDEVLEALRRMAEKGIITLV